MNVFIVDPNAERRNRLLSILAQRGHDVSGFADGDAALAAFERCPFGVVIADDQCRKREGWDLFRKLRIHSPPTRSYLIALVEPRGIPAGTGNGPPLDAEVDDLLSAPFRPREVLDRVRVAGRVLERRRDEALQMERISQVPAESPHPILELSGEGELIHANLSCLRVLEAWGWTVGQPIPAPFRRLARSAVACGMPQRDALVCGDRRFAFLATGLEGGDVCLYGSEMSDALEPEAAEATPCPSPALAPGRGIQDALTGLPTRLVLTDRLAKSMEQARREGSRLAVVKVNIDNCSEINGAYGRELGDRLILLLGDCLRHRVRSEDVVLRDHGDGFLLLLQGVADREAAGETCGRLIRAAQEAAVSSEVGVRFTLSMGLGLFPDDAEEEQALLGIAEIALEGAKHAGRNCWRDYPMVAGANPMVGSDGLLARLIEALHANRMDAHYQPIMAAATGRLAGFEALVRWQDPELGWIRPDRFIPLAEARGLIVELGRQMADRVFRQLAVWRAQGYRVEAALNISKQQLLQEGFCGELERLANAQGVASRWIVLEVTERQSLLSDRECRKTLEHLAKAGFRLSLDDFGSGHSTFDVLSELPFHELKINMELSRKAHSERGAHVVRAILGMCRDLGLESVAEGIEDEALGEALKTIGASRLQGYFYSPPLTAEASLEFLRRHGDR